MVERIQLRGYFLTRAFDVSKTHAFRLASDGKRTYTFAADDAADMTRWATAIGQAIATSEALVLSTIAPD